MLSVCYIVVTLDNLMKSKKKLSTDSSCYKTLWIYNVVATTCCNGTRSLLTLAKLSVGYLVVGITRELNKEPLLY